MCPLALGCGAMRSYIWISLRRLRSWAWSHLESPMGPALPFLEGVRAFGNVLISRGTGSCALLLSFPLDGELLIFELQAPGT